MHPQFEGLAGLLPKVGDAPPTFEVVEQRFDTPVTGIETRDGFGGEMGLSGSPFKVMPETPRIW